MYSTVETTRSELFAALGVESADEIAGRMVPTYGDYFGLVTLPDGRFRSMWPEMRDGHAVLTERAAGPSPS